MQKSTKKKICLKLLFFPGGYYILSLISFLQFHDSRIKPNC